MIEPMIATRKLQALKPVTPTPPAASKMKPSNEGPGNAKHDALALCVDDLARDEARD